MASIKWTGKNFAEVKALHKSVAHYPASAKGEAYYRDATQHPDNLHLEVEGRTLIAAVGDTITKDAGGRITVQPTGKRPTASGTPGGRTVKAEGTDSMKGKGGAK